MRTVADEADNRYLLLKQSREAWLVRDPRTNDERHLPADELTVVDGESPLETAARAAPASLQDDFGIPNQRAVGLLAEIHAREPVAVRDLMGSYDLCESDLHGLLGEFTAGELIQETTVAGERGYETTEQVRAAFTKAD